MIKKIIFFFTFFTVFLFLSPLVYSQGTWFDIDWNFRRPVDITENSGSDLTNYPVKIIVIYDSDMNSDFSDLRFTDSDETTLVPYWVESYTPSTSATVWVNVPNILASSTKTIYMYYGNPSVSSTSNATETYDFYEDFEDETVGQAPSRWSSSESWTVVMDGTKVVKGPTAGDFFTYLYYDTKLTENFIGQGYVLEAALKPDIGIFGTFYRSGRIEFYDTDDFYMRYYRSGGSYTRGFSVKYDNVIQALEDTIQPWYYQWYQWKLVVNGSTIPGCAWYIDGSLFDSNSTCQASIGTQPGGLDISLSFRRTQGEFDNITLRKYTSPEPTHGSWESEEIAPEPSWLSGFNYRKSHVINSAAGADTNYQVKIVVHSGSGTDSGEDVYLNGHAQNWPDDLRFTDNDGATELDYWLESYDASTATFWVEVRDDLSTADRTIYMYYGNSGATTTSDGSATFDFFDDFETDLSQWTTGGSPTLVASEQWHGTSSVEIEAGDSLCHDMGSTGNTGILSIHFKENNPSDSGVRFRLFISGGADCTASAPTLSLGVDTEYNKQFQDGTVYSIVEWQSGEVGTGYSLGVDRASGWHDFEVKITGSDYTATCDGNGAGSRTSPYLSSFGSFQINLLYDGDVSYWDAMTLRKYASPEPTHGSWGSEESPPEPLEIRSLHFSTTLDQININWVTEYGGATVNVECELNGLWNCNPFPYSSEPGGGGCTILLPPAEYDMTPDPGGELRTNPNTIYCKAFDPIDPGTYVEVTRIFYPISFEVFMPSSMSLVVGEGQDLVIIVKNNGTLSDTYGISVVATDPGLLIIENGAQTTASLSTNDVQQIYVGVNVLSSEQTATADVSISSDTSQSPNKIESDQTLIVKGGLISLPDFGFFGIIQIMLIAAVVLVSFLF